MDEFAYTLTQICADNSVVQGDVYLELCPLNRGSLDI
jgi:hypothetical protein